MSASLRVMVVDDFQAAADTIARLVGQMGPKTAVAYDAATALSLADSFQPDLMLVDLAMPHIDGLELARQILIRQGQHPQLVAVTGYGDFEHFKMAIEAGFRQVVAKPVSQKELRSIVEAVKATKK